MPINAEELQRARAVKPLAEKVFGDLLGDVAVGITRIDGTYGIKINVVKMPSPSMSLPSTVQGVPVRLEVTGQIRKQA